MKASQIKITSRPKYMVLWMVLAVAASIVLAFSFVRDFMRGFRTAAENSRGSYTHSSSCNVAVIPLYGPLLTTDQQMGSIPDSANMGGIYVTSDVITSAIDQAAADSSIEAIALDVDSPGGSPVAADEVERALRTSRKPTVSVVHDNALSGGYLAAIGADKVFASKYSLLGSIGVTASYLDETKKNQKEGVMFEQLSAGQFKDTGNPDKPLTAADRKLIQSQLEKFHQLFIDDVARLRGIEVSTVESLADGSTYLAAEAVAYKLIDAIGGWPEAQQYLTKQLGHDITFCLIPSDDLSQTN